MKTKAILVMLGFFIGTPLILGQTEIPGMPSRSEIPNINTNSPFADVPVENISNSAREAATSALPIESLNNAGLNTASLTNLNTASAMSELQARLGNQGILNDAISTPIPNSNNAASLAQNLAQRTFPEEYQAAQGGVGHIESLQSTRPNLDNLSDQARGNLPNPSALRDRAMSELPATPGSFSTPTLPFSTPSTPFLTPSIPFSTPSVPFSTTSVDFPNSPSP